MACMSPVSSGAGNPSGKGSLSIALTNNINARTLVPTISMDATSYTVTGTGPSSATFTATTTGAAVTENSLAFGSWTIVVNALNASGDLIGTGTASTQVNTGATSTVSVSVTPIAGTGTLSLSVSWPAAQVQTPSIAASLTPALGTAQSLPFVISGSSATYSSAAIGNGYYTLAFTLQDNGIVVAGAVEVARIVAGQTTSGTYTFTNVNAPGGSIQVNINADMQNPLGVTIAGASATMSAGSTQNLTASVSNYTGNVSYVWYVNGVSAGTGSSYSFGSGVGAGYYRIDVAAYSADGTRAGSATANVQIASTPVYVAYVANVNDSTISEYAINASTGALTSVGTVAISLRPFSMTVDPFGKFVYVANNDSSTVSEYTINASTGALTLVGTAATGSGPFSVAVDPFGKFVYVANNTDSTVSEYTINASTGALTLVGTAAAGSGPNSVTVDPSGKFTYVVNGANTVSAYTINASTGALTLVGTVATGSYPGSVTVDRSGKFAYVTSVGDSEVSEYTINASTGALTLVGTVATAWAPVGVTVDLTGKFAYVTNGGDGADTVSEYTISASTGSLTLVATVATGTFPSSVTVDPTGKFAYVANLNDNTVSEYTINPSTGVLTSIGTTATATGSGPHAVIAVKLP
jgi:6-phosphogluconolactonase (cycloisomerase 2 family)